MGKTTILSILYHTVSLNFTELLEYDFETIMIKYKNCTPFSMNKSDIIHFYKKSKSHKRIPNDIRNIIEEISEDINIDIHDIDDNINIISRELSKRGYRISRNLIREITINSYQHNPDELRQFVNKTNEILGDFKILYFPTYRRIEEDIYTINNDDSIAFEDNEINYFSSSRKYRRKSDSIGELIQFGMNDVEQTLDELLDTIKKTSIESFNKMTGELLNQYVYNNIETNLKFLQLTEKEILISLSRVGTEIKTNVQDEIIKLFKEGTLKDNKYLMNFIINLVNKNHSLEHIDNKIQKFVDVCNGYLYGKKFIYDPSAVTLEIQSYNHLGTIPLAKLSSGEKQIISTFSKIYLKNDENLIILFDEPELSLSIDWQKKFIYDVTQAENCKFSISVTHSAYIFSNMMKNATELNKYLKVVD